MIRFACPNCQAVLQSPAQTAGDKVECPKCGQRARIPNPVKPAASNEDVLPAIQAQHKPSTNQPEPSLSVCLEEVQDAEGKPFGEKRTIRKSRSEPSNTAGTGRFGLGFGVFLCIAGCLITLVYWLDYDTSVLGGAYGYERTHNVGKMNNRIVGTIVGVGMALGGLIVSLGSELLDSITRLKHLLDREDDQP
jgi:DNA-directed RNA polymerase subunit M/transcription elongation factor TFIIS